MAEGPGGPIEDGRDRALIPGSADDRALEDIPDEVDDLDGSDVLPPAASGPPGGGIFSLEDRPAPGLYFLAWLLTAIGLAVFLVGFLSGQPGFSAILIVIGLIAIGGGLSIGAGYQLVARADRHPAAYRGPSPFLLFGIVFVISTLLAILLRALGLFDAATTGTFLLGLLLTGAVYLVVVVVFVVRGGALRWREMGWPAWAGRPQGTATVLGDIAYAGAVMIPVTFGALILAGIAALLLGVRPPEQLPQIRGTTDAVLVALAAAIVAPIGEELFFRGFALTAWWRDLGPRRALIRSSLFFAFVHVVGVETDEFSAGLRQAILVLIVITPVAFVLGWLFQRRGIVASITGHIAYNGVQLALFALATQTLPQG